MRWHAALDALSCELMTPERLEQLTRIALETAEEAAAYVMRAYRTDFASSEKGRADLVTEYDLASERLIRRSLKERTPDLPVVGEEEGGRPEGPTWFCDPIDGTTNFVHGHPFFCVSIGLMRDGEPWLGAVVAPALGLRWHGFRGGEALRNGQPCRVSDTLVLSEALLATGFNPQSAQSQAGDNVDSFRRVLPHVRGIRRCGAAALDLCMTADGTYDAFWERKLNAWDCAAGAALVLAAGGRVTNLMGGPADLSVGHVLASNGHVHEAVLALLPETEQGIS
jgi:myo-inositol-1(or 4)-monophosphatase